MVMTMTDTNTDEWVIRWKEFKTYHKKMVAANEKKYQIMDEETARQIEEALANDTVTEEFIDALLRE